ncbi:Rrf2 family transcriptional regulator [Sphingopyxis sp. MWB1]|uniref:Rrf2 family transcriptional regulator n=1 Tax=Sphingopyxis sp. MWB1 TaxID=1537715 RepID=UPI000519EFF5|nr:Rrf2 family transcriptional regulator [Sphingopyxis sp. MWB1]
MKRDSRLSGILHVLLHMAEAGQPLTSEQLAQAMQSNAAVVRRILGGLRNREMVRSEKGHGGGWTLACDLSAITLRDIYEAIGAPRLMAMSNRTEAPGCLVEQAVNAALDSSFSEAETLLLTRFEQVTLAALAADFHARMAARSSTPKKETPDG